MYAAAPPGPNPPQPTEVKPSHVDNVPAALPATQAQQSQPATQLAPPANAGAVPMQQPQMQVVYLPPGAAAPPGAMVMMPGYSQVQGPVPTGYQQVQMAPPMHALGMDRMTPEASTSKKDKKDKDDKSKWKPGMCSCKDIDCDRALIHAWAWTCPCVLYGHVAFVVKSKSPLADRDKAARDWLPWPVDWTKSLGFFGDCWGSLSASPTLLTGEAPEVTQAAFELAMTEKNELSKMRKKVAKWYGFKQDKYKDQCFIAWLQCMALAQTKIAMMERGVPPDADKYDDDDKKKKKDKEQAAAMQAPAPMMMHPGAMPPPGATAYAMNNGVLQPVTYLPANDPRLSMQGLPNMQPAMDPRASMQGMVPMQPNMSSPGHVQIPPATTAQLPAPAAAPAMQLPVTPTVDASNAANAAAAAAQPAPGPAPAAAAGDAARSLPVDAPAAATAAATQPVAPTPQPPQPQQQQQQMYMVQQPGAVQQQQQQVYVMQQPGGGPQQQVYMMPAGQKPMQQVIMMQPQHGQQQQQQMVMMVPAGSAYPQPQPQGMMVPQSAATAHPPQVAQSYPQPQYGAAPAPAPTAQAAATATAPVATMPQAQYMPMSHGTAVFAGNSLPPNALLMVPPPPMPVAYAPQPGPSHGEDKDKEKKDKKKKKRHSHDSSHHGSHSSHHGSGSNVEIEIELGDDGLEVELSD